MREGVGVLAAILSSAFGGMAGAVTRFVIGSSDPVSLAAFRFGIGIVLLAPIALMLAKKWPRRRDIVPIILLGVAFFAAFFIVYNIALSYTTAARGALALSTLPLQTMVVGALLGIEPMTGRKTSGVLIAMTGVALALITGLADAPADAIRGDLIMLAGTLSMAFYNVWSRPFIARSGALAYVTIGMAAGAAVLVAVAWSTGGIAVAVAFGSAQWLAVLYLGAFGGAAAFYLWVFALERTTPTRVANTMTVNPLAASLLAAVLVNEPIGVNLIAGLIAVATGIWLAATPGSVRSSAEK
jgi:drug/metabolite transporter (DMT)-like permease